MLVLRWTGRAAAGISWGTTTLIARLSDTPKILTRKALVAHLLHSFLSSDVVSFFLHESGQEPRLPALPPTAADGGNILLTLGFRYPISDPQYNDDDQKVYHPDRHTLGIRRMRSGGLLLFTGNDCQVHVCALSTEATISLITFCLSSPAPWPRSPYHNRRYRTGSFVLCNTGTLYRSPPSILLPG